MRGFGVRFVHSKPKKATAPFAVALFFGGFAQAIK
jgi:hypothetical protein